MNESSKRGKSIRKIRIVFLAYYPPSRLEGHVEIVRIQHEHPASWVVWLAHGLSNRADVELHIVTESPNVQRNQAACINGVWYHFLKMNRSRNLSLLYVPNAIRINKVVRQIRPDIVHAHGTEGSTGMAAWLCPFPVLLTMQGVLTKIAETDRKFFGRVSTKLKIMAAIERFVLRQMAYIGVRTEFDTSFARSVNPKAKTYHAPEAVNPSFLNLKPSLKRHNILFVGSLIARKDIVTLVNAFVIVKREFGSARLRLVGDGDAEYIALIRQAVRTNNLEDSVELLGHQSASEIAKLLQNSSVFALPSLIENSPNVILEAMAAGVPVVASRVGGIPSLVQEGTTGILFEAKDAAGLGAAIIRLLKDSRLRSRMGRAAKERVRAHNHPSVVANRMMDIYADIIQHHAVTGKMKQ